MLKLSEAAIRNCSVFENASSATIDRFCNDSTMVKIGKNKIIYEEGDKSRGFHIIISGMVRAKGFSPDGKEVTYLEISEGGVFGEFAALDQSPRSATVIAVNDVIAASLPSETLLWAAEHDPGVAMALINELIAKNRVLTERIFEFSVLAVRQRVQAEIIRIAKSDGKTGETGITVKMPTHQEFAFRIATHREAITRELKFLESKGLILLGKGQITIPDLTSFENFAGNLSSGRS